MKNKSAVKFDEGKPKIDLLVTPAGTEIAKALTYGGQKYSDDFNYMRGDGLSYRRLASSGLRHWAHFVCGRDVDEESGLHHLAHAGACAIMALNLFLLKRGLDDRMHKEIE